MQQPCTQPRAAAIANPATLLSYAPRARVLIRPGQTSTGPAVWCSRSLAATSASPAAIDQSPHFAHPSSIAPA
jgi:hypothetical protein